MNDPLLHSALGSATAGIVSRIFTHPLDTAKARLQAPVSLSAVQVGTTIPTTGLAQLPYRGPIDVLLRTFRNEGVRGLYRGFGAIVVGGTPGTMLYLCSYEFFKKSLSSRFLSKHDSTSEKLGSGGEFLVHFSSGMLAETVACVIYVPVDVIKERLQVQQQHTSATQIGGQYHGSFDAMKKIALNEGLRGIYKGYAATLASFGPFSALYFVFYENFKDRMRKYLRKRDSTSLPDDGGSSIESIEIPFPHLIACSAGAGALASWLTSPLDMAKLRLQVQRGKLASGNAQDVTLSYKGMVDCLGRTFREAGFRGLFRGAGARVMHFAPATTITMTCYEKCRSFYARTLSGQSA